jgi:hypothetical protein
MVLFPLKLGKGDKAVPKETPSKQDPLSCLPFPYNPEALASQVESQDQDGDSSQRLLGTKPEFPSEPPSDSPSPSASTSGHGSFFSGLRRELQ